MPDTEIRSHWPSRATNGQPLGTAAVAVAAWAAFAAVGLGSNPVQAKRWSPQDAAHLLRRAGFGGTPEEVDRLTRLGRKKAVDSLLNYEELHDDAARPDVELFDRPGPAGRSAMTEEQRQQMQMEIQRKEIEQVNQMRAWWIGRMAATPRPLQEKMVLFWHGHFTSGFREVHVSALLWRQNEMFRRMATGNYRDLLLAVSRDPAMLLYLNGAQSNKNHPNENYARELMELFTLGIGHYTEQDVKEAARAFTGWSIERETGQFVFRRRQHDFGTKTVLGMRGSLDGGDVIDIILSKPRAAEHLVECLWRFFVNEQPPVPVVRYLAGVLRKNRYEIKPLLRAMFMHDAFYAGAARFAHVKSPVELLVGTMRALEIRPANPETVAFGLRLMGQDLFQPPNVKGWDGGLHWINTATLFNRYNVTGRLIAGTGGMRPRGEMNMRARVWSEMRAAGNAAPQPPFDPMPFLRRYSLRTPEQIVDHFVDRLLGRPISEDHRATLIEALRDALGNPGDLSNPANAAAIRELIQLIVAMPEYELS